MSKSRGAFFIFMEKYEDKVHIVFAIFWALMTVPTLLFWSNSVAVVLIYSVYALVGAHIAAYEGAKDDKQIDELARKVDELHKCLDCKCH
jgi:hypothetical protein